MKSRFTSLTIAAALTLQGCSSRPREFAPRLATPASSSAELDAAIAQCSQLLVAGKLDRDGRVGSGAAGAAAGSAVAVAGGAAAASMVPAVGAALASATIVLIPFVALGGAWGMAKMKRTKKEKMIRAALTGCLREKGIVVTGWDKTGRKVTKEMSKASSR